MKKEDILGTIAYLLILAFGVVFFFTIIRAHGSASGLGDAYVWFNVGAILAGIVINAFLFELAHVLGAIIGGYEISKVSVLGLTLRKEEKGYRFCISRFDGLTGETKIVPSEKRKKPNPYPYLLFGTLFFILEAIAIMIPFSMYRNEFGAKSNIVYFFLIIGAVGLMILIYNILPFQLDCKTDGYSLTLLTNPRNRAAYNELLRVKYELARGNNVEIKTFTEITNFTADLNLNKVYFMLNERKYDEAEKLIDQIVDAKQNISYKVFIRAKAQKVFIRLMTLNMEDAQKYYDEEVPVSERRDFADDVSIPSIRVYLLMAGLLDKSRSECIRTINNANTAFKRVPETRRMTEANLYNEALKMVCDAHPKWELEQYKLNYTPKEKKNDK